jgi:hypothetical protein
MMKHVAGWLSATTIFALAMPAMAQAVPAKPMTAPVPTTKILAIGSIVGAPGPVVMKAIMTTEVRETVKLYLAGKIDQWWVRQDGRGVVFLMNVGTTEEAHALLEALPLGQKKLMTFDLIPLGPLSPLRFLLPEGATP